MDGTGQSRYTYLLPSCIYNSPYNQFTHNRCTHTQTDWYSLDPNTGIWTKSGYEIPDYDPGNCLSKGTIYYLADGTPLGRWSAWYWTPEGNYPNKITKTYDNSEARVTRIETEIWDGTQWVKSTSAWYSYEDIPMATEDNSLIPIYFELKQNYPNPFNPITSIIFELPQDSHISIKIYNSLGSEIKTLVNEFKPVGQYQVNWDGTDNTGDGASGGTYFCQLQTGDFTQTRKMVLLK